MRKKRPTFITGTSAYRRTETDYMASLLETVTIDDWRGIIAATVDAAKQGDSSAKGFLAQYLVGKTALTAPRPLTVVVQQLSGRDPVIDELVSRQMNRIQFPNPYQDKDLESRVGENICEELRLQEARAGGQPVSQKQGGSADDFGKI